MKETAIEKVGGDMDITGAFSSVGGYELAQRVAKGLAQSSLVPKEYYNNIPNVLLAMEIANRTGSSIFAVMQNLYIVHGKPGFSSTYLIGTVNSCGRFTPLRYRFQGTVGKMDWGCRAYAEDKESGEECVGPLITMQIAKDETWLDRKGSKWKTLPELMLMYRSAAFWSRVFAPELSLGMQSIEEVHDVAQPVYASPAEVQQPQSPTDKMAAEFNARVLVQKPPEVGQSPWDNLKAEAVKEFGDNGMEWIKHQMDKRGWDDGLTNDQINELLKATKGG